MNGKLIRVGYPRRAGVSRQGGGATENESAAQGATAGTVTAEQLLQKAIAARSPTARARWARRGLATRAPLDKTTHAMLLRQLYLSYYEGRRFPRARAIAVQALELDVLVDVFHQDAARAALGTGDLSAAVGHLRIAARRGPASRRPFHLWTLGSTLFLAHRYAESIGALARAVRWATSDKPLYREPVDDVQSIIEELALAPCGQGYGRFVLGHLSYAAGARDAARLFLQAFIRRTESAQPALALALDGELRMARATLAKMSAN